MKIYISGAISNDPDYKMKFAKAEAFLQSLGYIVINPAKNPEGLTYKEYIDLGLKQLCSCDAVFALRDTNHSKGARLELAYAHTVNMPIYYDDTPTRWHLEWRMHNRIPWEAD